jgi:HrpA-like RNA helicase
MEKQGIPILQCDDNTEDYHDKIQKAICEGFFMQVARLLSNGYYEILKDAQSVRIHPSSSIQFGDKPSLILYHEIIMSKQNYIRTCTPIQRQWLYDIALQYYVANSFAHMLK